MALDGATTVRHALASLAYRMQTAVKDAPEGFGEFEAGHGVRTPAAILRHMTHVIEAGRCRTAGAESPPEPDPLGFPAEIARFHDTLTALDRALETETREDLLKKLLQGPISDALTHAGQLALLRRMAGASVQGQSFAAADIRTGNVGPDQAAPRKSYPKE
jgi:hypothetical protein